MEGPARRRRLLPRIALAVLASCACAPAASAATYYVDPNGSDTNPGTSDQPWRTFYKATSSTSPGDTAYLRPGTYGARGTRTYVTRNGAPGAPITIAGAPGGAKPSILGAVRIGGSNWRFTNLSFDGPTGQVKPVTSDNPKGEEVQFTLAGNNIELDHSVIQDNGWHAGVFVGSANNARVVNNVIRNNGDRDPALRDYHWNYDHGVYWSGGENGLLANNLVEGNVARGVQLYNASRTVTVTHNTIVRNGQAGILFGSKTENSLAVNNLVAYNGDKGIRTFALSGGGNVARNNLGFANTGGDFVGEPGKLTLEGNFTADPRFVNPTGDYHLGGGSGALDLALPQYATSDDLDSLSRPQGPASDVGAYERLASATVECQDGSDNDADGLIDYPADPDCSSASDVDERPAPTCASSATATAAAQADGWLDQNSPSTNKGTDSILKIRSQSGSNNFRSLVRFTLPAVPPGCRIVSAKLRLYAGSATSGRTLQAYRLAGSWSETGVTWSNQPATTGAAAATSSGTGYREWLVTEQVQAMYAGPNNGFLIRDATEGGSGAEQSFHSREKGDNAPQLLVTFGP